MPEYDNNNRGALFVNDRKDSNKHPDYKGTAEVEGVECWVSCWIKTSAKGAKYLSLAFTPKEEQASSVPRKTNNDAADFLSQNKDKADKHKPKPNNLSGPIKPNQPDFDSFDDDIPF